MGTTATPFVRQFFHGTRAALGPGDQIDVGHASNFTEGSALSWVYFAGTLDAAIWGAELADGNGRARIFVVEPTGEYEDDPNLTNQRFAGNPTQSYRSRAPLRIVAEVVAWTGHPVDSVLEMKASALSKRSQIID